MTTSIGVKLLNPSALYPTRAHTTDAGWDIFVPTSVTLHRGQATAVPVGIALDIPAGWEAQVRSRSGLAAKFEISVLNSPGTIDAGYKGEIIVILYNHSRLMHFLPAGSKIAQLVFKRVPDVELVPVDEVGTSERGEEGLGSTGI